jgi:uncharacterized coiled-coil protein SlyX
MKSVEKRIAELEKRVAELENPPVDDDPIQELKKMFGEQNTERAKTVPPYPFYPPYPYCPRYPSFIR